MGERRFRTVDGMVGILGAVSLWLMIRGGFGDISALHAWALVVAGLALGAGMWAMGTYLAERVVRDINRQIDERVARVASDAVREMVLDELTRPRR